MLKANRIPLSRSAAAFGKKIDSARLVPVAALKKGIGVKERAKAVLDRTAFEEFLPNGLWNQDTSKEKAELGEEIKMLKRDNT